MFTIYGLAVDLAMSFQRTFVQLNFIATVNGATRPILMPGPS